MVLIEMTPEEQFEHGQPFVRFSTGFTSNWWSNAYLFYQPNESKFSFKSFFGKKGTHVYHGGKYLGMFTM